MFSDMLFNPKVTRQLAQDKQAQAEAAKRAASSPPPSATTSSISSKPETSSTALIMAPASEDCVAPGPAARDTMPLRALFAEHIDQVSRIPLILHNMPIYYAIVSSALDTALEEAEFTLRSQATARTTTWLDMDPDAGSPRS